GSLGVVVCGPRRYKSNTHALLRLSRNSKQPLPLLKSAPQRNFLPPSSAPHYKPLSSSAHFLSPLHISIPFLTQEHLSVPLYPNSTQTPIPSDLITSAVIMSSEPVGDFGLIGLAVMGQNLILNAADHGFTVVAFNRTTSKVDRFLANEAKGKSIVGAHSVEEFVAKLKRPRRIMLLVMAGKPVDDFIETLLPHLEKGDIIIDGGNSHFPDTTRRTKYLSGKGIRFVGSGVSGGEEGARYGPSLMPGGNEEAWPYIKDVFQSIAAKSDGEPCCE
ncbi:hypothetical protein DH86_00000209, partial [Scytalidium sp. 3C]